MLGEIITIGNELTSGRTLDLNSWYAAQRLTSSGLHVTRITSVGDDFDTLSEVLMKAVETSGFVIVTGGLGSTDDDLTNEIVAKVLNRPLTVDRQMFGFIKSRAEVMGIEMTPSLEKMAWVPEGSRILNPEGGACGCYIKENETHLYFLPGVPDQMSALIDNFVLSELLSLSDTFHVVRQRTLKLYGLNETSIAEIFNRHRGKTGDVVLGFYPNFPENHITISLKGKNEAIVEKELDRVEKEIRLLVGNYIFATGNQNMEDMVGRILMETKMTLSIAESCTGGLIGHMITNAQGSSGYFKGGIIAYSDQAKIDLLHVHPTTLEANGAVSDATVREMAIGVKEKMNTDFGLAVTGIAGPAGGNREKPVGTVHLGLVARNKIFSEKYRFWGNRKQIKLNTAMMVLDWVRRYLNGNSFLPGI